MHFLLYFSTINITMIEDEKLRELDKTVQLILDRNQRVETDKAWETSNVRKITILILTYILIVLFMFFANISNPFISAIVPAVGFLLSTLTLPIIKKWWIKNYAKRNA